jgi:hypothetical protein
MDDLSSTMFASSIVSLLRDRLIFFRIHSPAATALAGLDCLQRVSSSSLFVALIRVPEGCRQYGSFAVSPSGAEVKPRMFRIAGNSQLLGHTIRLESSMVMDRAQHKMHARMTALRTILENKEELFHSRVATGQITPEGRAQSLSELSSIQAEIEKDVIELQRQMTAQSNRET